jgi:hypothetical protein
VCGFKFVSEIITEKEMASRENLEKISPMHSAQEWACLLAHDLLPISHQDVYVTTGLYVYNVYHLQHATSTQNLRQH